jgi:two-component system sensor histidine kinase/response regulator
MTNYSDTQQNNLNEQPPQNAALLLDTDRAMASMGGKTVYLHILDKFVTTRSDMVNQLREALIHGEQKQARHLVHTLKGVAATIGASYLSEAAVQLETFIDENAACESQIISTERAMSQTLLRIKAFQTAQQPAPEIKSDLPELTSLIEQLNLQLDNFDASANDTMLSINRPEFIHLYDFKELIKHLDAYDYENARLETRRLTGK